MQLTLEREALVQALEAVQSAAEREASVSALANVLIEAEGDHCSFAATNMEIQIRHHVAAKVEKPAKLCTRAHTLFAIARTLAQGAQASLKLDDTMLNLVCGRSKFALPTSRAADFPNLTAGEYPHQFTIAAGDMRLLIEKTQFAISTEEGRFYLNGIYFHVPRGEDEKSPPQLRAVATDGHRLARAQLACPQEAATMPGVIVPRKTVAELLRLAAGAEEINVSLSKTMIRYEVGNSVLVSKLIDGTFPDYARVIPQGNQKQLKVGKEELMHAVQRVAAVFPPNDSGVVKFSLKTGKIELSTQWPDLGKGVDEIDAEYQAEPMDIGFSANYMLDIIQCTGAAVQIDMADPGTAAVLCDPAGEADVIYVLMPARV